MLLLGILAALLIFAATITYTSFSWGLVMLKFWYWFLIPVFITVPHINYWPAMGLIVFLMLLKTANVKRNIKEQYLDDDKTTPITIGILAPWITLGVGYFIYLIIN